MNTGEYSTMLRIDATPDDVFPYLTDASLIVQWMGDWADLDPTVGGRFVLDINGIAVRGRYLTVEPPHRVVFTWGTPGNDRMPPESTTVEITLHEDGDATIVELVHRQLPDEDLPQHSIGWDHFIPRLVLAASGINPGADPRATAR
jgi:uncharacterized protein YndB with AHSA1/START domain